MSKDKYWDMMIAMRFPCKILYSDFLKLTKEEKQKLWDEHVALNCKCTKEL